jgi:hypothetical protein
MNKLKTEQIKEIVESAGYLYIEQEYKSINDKNFRVICPKHGEFTTSIATLQNYRSGCPECRRINRSQYNKTPFEEIEKVALQKHYKLLISKEEYENTNYKKKVKIKISCQACGKESEPFLQSLMRSLLPCKQCFPPHIDQKRERFEKIQKEITDKGYSCKFEDFTNSHNIIMECPLHGRFKRGIGDLRKGMGCPKCGKISSSNKQKIPYSQLVEILSKKQWSLDINEEQYKNTFVTQGIPITCSCGEKYVKTIAQIKKNKNCKNCQEFKKYTIEQATEIHAANGYRLIDTEYINANSLMLTECPKHGDFRIRLSDLLNGHGCSACNNILSKNEIEIGDIIKEWGFDIEKNNRTLLEGKEIDIYIPNLNVGIEYTGLRFHSELMHKNKYNIRDKHVLAKKLGINLITIYENEWLESKDKVLSILQSKLNLKKKIYARKTAVGLLSKEEANSFNNKWHLQGASKILLAVGLKFNNEIVGVMTFAKHHRGVEKGLVLNRMCFGEYSVIGGANKMLNFAIPLIKTIGYNVITTWSDNRWSEGGVYDKMGFQLDKNIPADYNYFKQQKIVSKQSCTKKNLIKKGGVGITEKEIAASIKLYRIWDAGKKKWVLKV